MKVLISLDMEGVSGIVSRQETLPVGQFYQEARRWYTWDANAAIEGALAGGATEIVVIDPHHQLNILWPELHPKAQLVRRDLISHTPLGSVEGLDETFDVVLFVGEHTRFGHERGVLSHTITRPFAHVRVNGELADEVKLATAIAGHMGVPVGLVTGDDAICEETKAWLPQVETAVVKYAIDTYAAVCLSKEEAHDRIRQAAQRAMEKVPTLKPFTFASPTELEVDLLSPPIAAKLTLLPGVERIGDLTVRYTSDNFDYVSRILRAMVFIAYKTRDPIPW
jgi:D-amino peptidase